MENKQMSHVVYLCTSKSWGGLEMNQWRNACWMTERKVNVTVIGEANSPLKKACEDVRIPFLTIPVHRKYYDFKSGKNLARILRSLQATHLIVRDTRDLSLAVIAKRHSNVHLSYFMEMQLGVRKKHLLHTLRFSYIDLWSCPLHWLKNQVLTMTNMDPQRVCIIPSGIDIQALHTDLDKRAAREALKLPLDVPIFGLIGRFDPHKGQLLLLEALTQMNNQTTHLCLLGEPTRNEGDTYYHAMLQTIEKHQLSSRVHIRPFRKDINTFYRAIDAFVLGSRAETFGMVTIEAMAMGTPIIASRSGGSPEILENGTLGRLYTPGDPSDLSQQMDDFLCGESPSAETMREAAKKYSHSAVINQVINALAV
jgi:glycosyltransferase involved in cell wall biosynthesis